MMKAKICECAMGWKWEGSLKCWIIVMHFCMQITSQPTKLIKYLKHSLKNKCSDLHQCREDEND